MATLLAIDTATEACSVALLYKDNIYHQYDVIPRLHAQKLLPMIKQVIDDAGIDLTVVDSLAFGRGPGAFTGMRIAAGVIQGLAFALDKPVIAISDLAILAQRAWRECQIKKVAVAIDARMNEIYWGCYQLEGTHMQLVSTEQVLAPEQVVLPNNGHGWCGVGTGWKYAEQISVKCPVIDDNLLPNAVDLLSLALLAWHQGDVVSPEWAEPVYLRDNVATPKQ